MSKNIDQLLKMADDFEKLSFNKKADANKIADILSMTSGGTSEMLEDLAKAQFIIMGVNPETFEGAEGLEDMLEVSKAIAELIRSIIPSVKKLEESVA